MQLSSSHYLKKKKTVIDDDISISLLTEKHKIKPFDCGDEQLNEFLLQEALPYKKELLATTFIIENNERTLGYYSLLMIAFGWKRLSLSLRINIESSYESLFLILNVT